MRIAVVQEQIDVRRGGAETSTLEMAKQLAALGLDVTLVYAGSDEATAAGSASRPPLEHGRDVRATRCSDEGLNRQNALGGWPTSSEVGDTNAFPSNAPGRDQAPTLKFHSTTIAGGSRVARSVRFIAEADRYCREQRFDIVHAVTPCFSCNVYQPRGGTYVETVNRSAGRSRTWFGRLIRRMGRRFNRRQRFLLLVERAMLTDRHPPFVAAVSEYVARQVRGAFPQYPGQRLRVVFNGVDINPLSPAESQAARAAVRRQVGIDDARPLVLFVAHNFKLKGLGELIHALAGSLVSDQSPALERTGQPRHRFRIPTTEPACPQADRPDRGRPDSALNRERERVTGRQRPGFAPGSDGLPSVATRRFAIRGPLAMMRPAETKYAGGRDHSRPFRFNAIPGEDSRQSDR